MPLPAPLRALLAAAGVLLLVAAWGPPVAVVGGEPVTADAFERSYLARLLETGADDTRAARWDHLDALIDTYLLAAEARRRGLEADADYRADVERARRRALAARYFTVRAVEPLAPPTEAELRAAWLRSRDRLVLRQLYYRDAEAARAAHERLRGGADFMAEARRLYGPAAPDSSAGLLGAASYFDLDDAVAEAVWGLGVGEATPPVRSRHGWHVVRVERRIRQVLPTEAEWARQRGLVHRRLVERRRRLAGDAFVRAAMDSLDVRVEPAGVAALQEALARLEHRARPEAVALDEAEVQAVMDVPALTPETVLATYEHAGERRAFTAADYAAWLGTVPFAEARRRTAASVGRALRNEVFAAAGVRLGLDADPIVRDEVDGHARHALARAALRHARQAGQDPEALLARLRSATTVVVDTARFEALMAD